MTGGDFIIREAHHIVPVALFDVVAVNANGPVSVQRTVKHFSPHSAVHHFQVTTVQLTIEIIAQRAYVVRLQRLDIDIILYIVTNMGTDAR